MSEQRERLERETRRRRWLEQIVEVGTPQGETISSAWGSWLSAYPWSHWGTLTFAAGEFSHEAATRAWSRFVSHVFHHEALEAWFVGHEVGARGRLHLHCLLGCVPRPSSEVWEWWFKRYGRNEIRGYDPERGAAHYVAKYVTKELAHYDLSLRAFEWQSVLEGHRPKRGFTRWRGPAARPD